jgi:hypothetical protein
MPHEKSLRSPEGIETNLSFGTLVRTGGQELGVAEEVSQTAQCKHKITKEIVESGRIAWFRGGEGEKIGGYQGTVTEWAFVVPFCHCLGITEWAVWGCVGKVRAGHIDSALLSLQHSTDAIW